MERNETIRITAVENGFLVDLAPEPNFISAKRQHDDYTTESVRVFETIEGLATWLGEHFTYRPVKTEEPADQWPVGELDAVAAAGPGPIVFNRVGEAPVPEGISYRLATKNLYDVVSGNYIPIKNIIWRHIVGVQWGTDLLGDPCLLVTLGTKS